MTFTMPDFRRLTPEESGPYNSVVSQTLKKYQQGVNAKYAPQRQEADIFAKEMSPMAALAANPNFKGFEPETSTMIAQKMQDYITKSQQKGGHEGLLNGILHQNWLGKQEEAAKQAATPLPKKEVNPGYASGIDLYNKYEKALKASANPSKLAASKFASRIAKNETGLTDAIAKGLGGSAAANASADAKAALADIAALMRREGRTDAEVKQIIGPDDEAIDNKLARLKTYIVPENYGDKKVNKKEGNEVGEKGNQQVALLNQEAEAYKVQISNFMTEYNASHPEDQINIDDLKHTALTHNITLDEVMQQLQGGQ